MGYVITQRLAGSVRLYRFSGCLFIRGLQRNSTARARIGWIGLYTVYSLLCVLVLIVFDAAFLFRNYFFEDTLEVFAKSVTLAYYVGLAVKLAVNCLTFLRGQSKILAFLRLSEHFEETTGFSVCESFAQEIRMTRLLQRLLTVVGFGATFVLGHGVFTVELISALPSVWAVPVVVGGSIGAAIHFIYDSLEYLFLVPCCEVIGQYIHAQREVFQNHLKTPNIVSNSSSHATIEDIRLNICRIKALKNKINDLWGWPLFTTFGSLVFLTCLCVYAVLGSSIGRGDTWIGISYSVFLWSTTLEIASVSQYMKDEVSFIQSRLGPLKHENISVVQYFLCDIHI